ncbi:unnamed protein product, partial [Mesorhabditis spiculigera]
MSGRAKTVVSIVSPHKAHFAIYLIAHLNVGFVTTLIPLSFSFLTCRSGIPSQQMFWIFFLFYTSLFVGTMANAYLNKKENELRMLIVTSLLMATTLVAATFVTDLLLFTLTFAGLGASMGIQFSEINVSYLKMFPQQHFSLLHTLHLSHSLGAWLASLMFRIVPRPDQGDCRELLFDLPQK